MTDETTQHLVTAVDTQGNESNGTFVTNQSYTSCEGSDCSAVTPEPTADGQYLIGWDDMTLDNETPSTISGFISGSRG